MKRVRILHIITRLILGGAQETAMLTAEKLDSSKYEVELLAGPQTGSEGSLIEEVHKRNVSLTILPELVREVNPIKDLIALLKLYRFIKIGNYRLVHTHSSKAGILGRLAARLAGVPVIVHTVHGWSFHDFMPPITRRMYIILEKLCAPFTNAYIIVTQRDLPKGISAGISQPDKYHLIRSAIPLDEFNPEQHHRHTIREELGVPQGAPVVGNVGRFSLQKNPLEWVKVAGIINRALPECYFLLVGDGPLRSQVESAIREEGLSGKIILTGLRRDAARMMAAMDVFLLTSLWEGLPRVVPQAMLMELPLVATSIDGTAEAIQEGITGYLASPGDLNALAEKCLLLLRNPGKRKEMGFAARQYALKEFDLQRMISQTEQLYDQLLSVQTGK